MYQPSHFIADDPAELLAMARAAPLATLVRLGPAGLAADLVPLEIEPLQKGWRLRGHVARANALWREADGQPVLVIFHGPQAYVSPGFYPSKAEHGKVVPTWNYLLVQAAGTLRAVDDAAWVRALVSGLTDHHEAGRPAPWALADAPPDYTEAMLRMIVGIEIDAPQVVGKRKLSQNRTPADRDGVIAGLDADAQAVRQPGAAAVAGAMQALFGTEAVSATPAPPAPGS